MVRLGLHAVRAVRLPVREPRGVRAQLPRAVHLRGDRPDPRLVLHADGRRDAGVRPLVVRDRALPRPHRRRGRPQDVQAPRQRARPVRAVRAARRRRAALADGLRGQPLVDPPGGPRPARRGRPQGAADLLEHRVVPRACTPTRTTSRRRPPRRRRPPSGRCSTAGRSRSCTQPWPRSTPRWRSSTPSARGGAWRSSSTTCPTGTSAAPAAGSGTATRPRWRRCTSAWRCSPS